MFILIVKDPDGYPPERTVWIEAAIDFSISCESSNLLRPVFARTFRDYRKSPPGVKAIRSVFADTSTLSRVPAPTLKMQGRAGEGAKL